MSSQVTAVPLCPFLELDAMLGKLNADQKIKMLHSLALQEGTLQNMKKGGGG